MIIRGMIKKLISRRHGRFPYDEKGRIILENKFFLA